MSAVTGLISTGARGFLPWGAQPTALRDGLRSPGRSRPVGVPTAARTPLPAPASSPERRVPADPDRPPIHPAGSPWILMYHSVTYEEDDPYQLTVSPERFAAQLGWLHRRGWRGVSVRELLAAHAAGRADRLVGLTFDDGYADFAGQVVPVLCRYGFTATVYVVAERLGSDNDWDDQGPRKPLLTPHQVRRLADAGWEIGSHGLCHRALSGLPSATLAAETLRSRLSLEEVVGGPVAGFCYPYGSVDERAAAAVRAAGYEYACAIAHSRLTGRFALPRCYVGERDGSWRLRAKRVRHEVRGRLVELGRCVPGPQQGAGR